MTDHGTGSYGIPDYLRDMALFLREFNDNPDIGIVTPAAYVLDKATFADTERRQAVLDAKIDEFRRTKENVDLYQLYRGNVPATVDSDKYGHTVVSGFGALLRFPELVARIVAHGQAVCWGIEDFEVSGWNLVLNDIDTLDVDKRIVKGTTDPFFVRQKLRLLPHYRVRLGADVAPRVDPQVVRMFNRDMTAGELRKLRNRLLGEVGEMYFFERLEMYGQPNMWIRQDVSTKSRGIDKRPDFIIWDDPYAAAKEVVDVKFYHMGRDGSFYFRLFHDVVEYMDKWYGKPLGIKFAFRDNTQLYSPVYRTRTGVFGGWGPREIQRSGVFETVSRYRPEIDEARYRALTKWYVVSLEDIVADLMILCLELGINLRDKDGRQYFPYDDAQVATILARGNLAGFNYHNKQMIMALGDELRRYQQETKVYPRVLLDVSPMAKSAPAPPTKAELEAAKLDSAPELMAALRASEFVQYSAKAHGTLVRLEDKPGDSGFAAWHARRSEPSR